MGKEDFLSFDEVMRKLNVSDQELQHLVSDMKISAIRSKGTLIFRRKDIAQLLKDSPDSESAIPAPAGDGEAATVVDNTDAFDIEEAPAATDEDEIGAALNFDEIPLEDAQELPSAEPASQDSTDTDLNLDDLEAVSETDDQTDMVIPTIELGADDDPEEEGGTDQDMFDLSPGEPEADDVSDTVIPTIELSSDDEERDDTTDTVIPTIELSEDDDLTDDTSDTVIPTIELGGGGDTIELGGIGDLDHESTETAFPTIELGGDEAGQMSDLGFDELGETSQETQDIGLPTDTAEMEFADTQTEEEIPTFEESPGIDTQQETSAVESQPGFVPGTEAATGAETAPIGGGELGGAAAGFATAAPITIGFGSVFLLLITLAIFTLSGVVLASAVTLGTDGFRAPDYLTWLLDFVRQNVLPNLI